MTDLTLLNISALIAILPLALAALRNASLSDRIYGLLLLVAVAGPGALLWLISLNGWRTDVSTSLWVSVEASLILFAAVCVVQPLAWRLRSLFVPYMFILAAFAVVWSYAGTGSFIHSPTFLLGWVVAHILVSVATYGLVTIAAVASLAAILQERAFKAKHPSSWVRSLPSLADCDRLAIRLLWVSEAVLALGLLSGMALQFEETNSLFEINHKTVLTLTAFVVIGCLLFVHTTTGLRGRKAARLVLLGYLLLTLGYPGVKFVSDVLLAG